MNLADRIIAYLIEHPDSHCEDVARGVRANTFEVRQVLQHDSRIAKRKGVSRGVVYAPRTAQDAPRRIAGRSRASRLYRVLRDREPHTRREVFEREGFMLTNNAAAELRPDLRVDGLEIVFDQKADSYQIVPLNGRVGESANAEERVLGGSPPSPASETPALSPTSPLTCANGRETEGCANGPVTPGRLAEGARRRAASGESAPATGCSSPSVSFPDAPPERPSAETAGGVPVGGNNLQPGQPSTCSVTDNPNQPSSWTADSGTGTGAGRADHLHAETLEQLVIEGVAA